MKKRRENKKQLIYANIILDFNHLILFNMCTFIDQHKNMVFNEFNYVFIKNKWVHYIQINCYYCYDDVLVLQTNKIKKDFNEEMHNDNIINSCENKLDNYHHWNQL